MPKALNLTERVCADCDVLKPIGDYYKNGATSHFKKCKICFCKERKKYKSSYVKKERVKSLILRRYDELSDETRELLKKQRDALVPLTSMAKLNDIPHHWLKKWKLVGLI